MELTFDLVEVPHVTEVAPFRYAHARVKGPYQPWARVQTLDSVAETLERGDVPREGPAFGVYYDLPSSSREPEDWRADLGFPVPEQVEIPRRPGLRVARFPGAEVASLRYRGDLSSFPEALQVLVDWLRQRGIQKGGPLLERFHVSDALTGAEERDVMIALRPLAV